MKRKFLNILRGLYIILIILLLILIISQLLPIETSINIFGFRPLVVVTDSMTGELDTLDLIVIKKTSPAELQVGDIITFYAPENSSLPKGSLITHFIASIESDESNWEIHTKSNLSQKWDDWSISERDIIGKKWFSIPKMGHIIIAFRNPVIVINSIVLVLILLAIIALWPKKSAT